LQLLGVLVHAGQVLLLLYRPFSQVLTVHRLETVLADHDGADQVDTLSIPQDMQAVAVLVPVPDVVVPAPHAVQLLAPVALREPLAHAPSHVLVVRSFPVAP
jgi:hypothetical protein